MGCGGQGIFYKDSYPFFIYAYQLDFSSIGISLIGAYLNTERVPRISKFSIAQLLYLYVSYEELMS